MKPRILVGIAALILALSPYQSRARAQGLAEQALSRGALRRSDEGSLRWRRDPALFDAIWSAATNDLTPLDLRAAAFTSLGELSDDPELARRIRALTFSADDPLAFWARRAAEKIAARAEAIVWLRRANEDPIPQRRLVDALAELLDDAEERNLRSDQRATLYSSLRRLGWSDPTILDRLSKRSWVEDELKRSALELLARASPELFANQAPQLALSSDSRLNELLIRQKEELPREAIAELVSLLETQPEDRVKIVLAKVFSARLGSVADAHLTRLADDLTESARVRLQAMVTLNRHRSVIGELAIERLLSLETAFPDDDRVTFIEAFTSVDSSALSRWIEKVCGELHDDRRHLALQLAESLCLSELARPMRALANDTTRTSAERCAAVRVLSSSPGAEAREALMRLALQANEPMIRRSALEGLGQPTTTSIGEARAFIQALDEVDESVVCAALRGLARAALPSSARRIVELTRSPSETVQGSAFRALRSIPIPSLLNEVLEAEPKTSTLQEDWLQVFALQPYRPALKRLCEYLDARQASLRRKAWQILSSWLRPQEPGEQRPAVFDPDAPPLLRAKSARAWLDWYQSESKKIKLRFEE